MSSLRSTSLGVMRPPKPPCWRDFVVPTAKSINSEGFDGPESSSRALGARSPVADLVDASRGVASLPGNKPSRLSRRPRARIHRTKSEQVIQAEDLPESTFTSTLADTDPKGMRVRASDGRFYVEENNRRCQNWLASIEAAEPLDKVDYTSDEQMPVSSTELVQDVIIEAGDASSEDTEMGHSSQIISHQLIPINELQQGVDIEIPEETFVWDASRGTRRHSHDMVEEVCDVSKRLTQHVDGKISSGTSPCSHSDMVSCSRHGETNIIAIDEETEEHQKRGSASGDDRPSAAKCGKKKLCGMKLHKQCCDHKDTKSPSRRKNDCLGCAVGCEKAVKSQQPQIPETEPSENESQSPSKPRRVRSSSRRWSARRLLSDSEILSLNQKMSD